MAAVAEDASAKVAVRITTLEELEEMRAEVAAMAQHLQASAKALAARVADADRREIELEQRRLNVARRHEEQLLDIEKKSRRILSELQTKLELSESRSKEKEIMVQDTLARLAAVQRDYDLLQAAMLRVQSREVTIHEQEVKLGKKLEEVQKALDASLADNKALREANATLTKQVDAAKSAMVYYRGECKRAIERHNALADSVRSQQTKALASERAELDTASRRQRLADLTNQTLSKHDGSRPGGVSRPWAHEMAMREGQASAHVNPLHHELKEVITQLTHALQQEDEQDRRRSQVGKVRSAAHRRERAARAKVSVELASAHNAAAATAPRPSQSVAEELKNRWQQQRVVIEPESCEISTDSDAPTEDEPPKHHKTDGTTVDHVFDVSGESSSDEHLSENPQAVPREQADDDDDRRSTHAQRSVGGSSSTRVADTVSAPDVVDDWGDIPTYVLDASTEALLAGRLPDNIHSRYGS